MTETYELTGTARESVGKANRRMAGSGMMPGVLYGVGHTPQAIAVDRHTFELLAKREGVTSSLVKLTVDERKPVNVIVKSIQHDPVKGTIIHADFWAVNMKQRISTLVPVHFIGDSPGVKAGGVMTHNMQQVNVEALPDGLPDYLEADISALEIGDSLHLSDLPVPDGVTLLDHPEEIVCSVMAPKALEVEEVVEEAAEPEVVGEKKGESGE